MVKISANNSNMVKELNASKRQLKRFQSSMPDLIPNGTGVAIAGAATAMGGFGVAAVKMAATLETNTIAFETMLGSAGAAENMLKSLQTFAATSPFEMTGLTDISKKMLGLGFTSQEIIPTLQVLGDAVSAVGGDTENLKSITDAFAKIRAQGAFAADQVNRISDAGLPAWQILAKVLNTDVATAMKMAEAKTIDVNTAMSGMFAEMTTRYGGAMTKMSATVTGKFSNIKDTATAIMQDIGVGLNKSLDVKIGLDNIQNQLNDFKNSVDSIGLKQTIIDSIPSAGVALAAETIAGALVLTAIPAISNFKIAMMELGLLSGPIGWVSLAVAGLTGSIVYLGVESQKTSFATSNLGNSLWSAGLGAEYSAGAMYGYANSLSAVAAATAQYNGMADYRRKEDSNTMPPVIPPVTPPTIPTGGGGSGGGGGGGSSEADNAAKEYEELKKEAKQTSDSIKDEWISLTGTQVDALNNWYDKELDDLNKSASANENYTNDKARLDQIYAEKKKKILADQQKETNSIWDKALSDATDYQNRLAEIGMGDGTKQVFEIKSNAAEELTKIQNAARDTEQAFEQLSNESKLQSIQAMTTAKTAFTVTKDGMVVDAKDLVAQVISGAATMSNTQISLAQDVADKTVIVNKEMAEKLKTIHQEIADFEGNLTKARNDGNLSALITELNSERAALTQDLAGRQEMFDVYYDAWKETHRTSMSYMAELTSGAGSSFKDFFSDIISGTSSASSAWSDLGQSIRKVIADMVAQWIAAQIKMAAMNLFSSIFGISLFSSGGSVGSTEIAGSTFSGVTRTRAAEFASGGFTGVFGSRIKDHIPALLTAGEYVLNSGAVSAIGVDNLNALNTGKLPGYATGGLVTGPSLSSLSGNYRAASPATRNTRNNNTAAAGQQTIIHSTTNVSTIDTKGYRGFLKNSGGRENEKYLARQAKMFAMAGVTR